MTTNYERAFAERPEVYTAWAQLSTAIKAGMDLRRYELATLAAARRLRSSYCCLAHGTVLRERFEEPVLEIALDHGAAGLDEGDVAVMDLSERVVDDATSIGDADLQQLRDLGLAETEIMDVILAAAARCFFSKTLDELGVRPDASYRALQPELREALGQSPTPDAPKDDSPCSAARTTRRTRSATPGPRSISSSRPTRSSSGLSTPQLTRRLRPPLKPSSRSSSTT